MKDESFGVIPIFRSGDEFLFLLIKHQKGHWGFPKGHKEASESDIEAAKREFEEETGISEYEIPDEKNFFIEEYFFKKENDIVYKTVKYFIAFTKNKNVNMQMSEVADFKWLPYEEAVSQLTFHEGKDIAKKANEFLKQLSLIL